MSSLETDGRSLYYNLSTKQRVRRVYFYKIRAENVYSHQLIVNNPIGGDFFYGKSSNENHLKAYEHSLVDESAAKIRRVRTARRPVLRFRPCTASHEEGSSYHPSCGTQVQGLS